jgi:hypothetical protein
MPRRGFEPRNACDGACRLSEALAQFAATARSDRVDFGAIVRVMERRLIGALLLILALPMVVPIPAPGISVGWPGIGQ